MISLRHRRRRFGVRRCVRIACGLVAVVLVLAPGVAARAQEVLIVVSSDAEPYREAAEACRARLSEAGRSARTIAASDWSPDRHGDGIEHVAVGGRAAKRLSAELGPSRSLYYCMAPSPRRLGLEARERAAGISAEVALRDQARLIARTLRGAARLGALYRSSSDHSTARLEAMRAALGDGVSLEAVDLDAAASPAKAIETLLGSGVDAVWTTPDPRVYDGAIVKALLLESLRRRVPVFGFSESLVRAGAMFGVGVDPAHQGRRVAGLLLEGRLGAHRHAQLRVAINLTVADRIDRRIPRRVRHDADIVYGGSDAD